MPLFSIRAKHFGAWDITPSIYTKDWFAGTKIKNTSKEHGYNLLESLKTEGQKEPLLVECRKWTKARQHYFYVEPGGSRWPAMAFLGWDTCRCVLKWDETYSGIIEERFSDFKSEEYNVDSVRQFFSRDSPTYQRILEWQTMQN